LATINGDRNRFKLRVRFYDDDPTTPVFFEIKDRMANKSRPKKRAAVRRDAVASLLAANSPQSSHLTSEDPQDFPALEEFCERMHGLNAQPKIHVAYSREAYMSTNDNFVRLTMDREVRADALPRDEQAASSIRLSMTMRNPMLVWGKDVVLELKFPDRFPDMFRELVHIFGLRRCGAGKYVDSIATLGEDKL